MRVTHSIQRVLAAIILFCIISAVAPAHAGEVDFFNLPFGADRSTIPNLSDAAAQIGEVDFLNPPFAAKRKNINYKGRTYCRRREKGMRFAGIQLYAVYYGFDNNRLVLVEAQTVQSDPVKSYCYETKTAREIRKKMISFFGDRIRHVGDYTSPPEEFRVNYAEFKECTDRFPLTKEISCEVDVFEKWQPGAKDTDRALEATLQEISIGRNPVKKCFVYLIFRPGRFLSEKRAEEQKWEDDVDELLGIEKKGIE